MTIKSKIHTYGNEHESSWPTRFPKDSRGVVGYIDSETKQFKEGYPPNPNNNFGTAPVVIFDAMAPAYHEAAGRTVESRAEWDRLDKKHNTLTFGSVSEPRRHMEKGTKEQKKQMKKDRRNASKEALSMVRSNPRHIHQKLQKEAEKQEKTLKKITENYKIPNPLKDNL